MPDYPLHIRQGETFTRTITRTNDDFTGATITFQIRRFYSSTSAVVTLTNGTGITVSGDQIVVVMSAAQTAALTGPGRYDLEVAYANGRVRRLLSGPVTVEPEVTR